MSCPQPPSIGQLPLVSVVMPVRNGAETLASAIESLRAQSLQEWELLVVNDGSHDATTEILARAAVDDHRVRPLHQPPRGIVDALNTGLAAARGPLIARMDADDVALPERLERQAALLEKIPSIGVVSCGVCFVSSVSSHAGYAAHVQWLNSLRSGGDIENNRFVESPLAHPSAMFRRELPEKFGAYQNGDFPEDYELWLRWMEHGVRFGKTPEPLLVWRDHPGRLSRNCQRYSTGAFYRLKCAFLARWLDTHVPRDRPLWLWGAGRITRKRFSVLESLHRPWDGFLDVDPRKIGNTLHGRPVKDPRDCPPEAFVVLGVGTRSASEKAAGFLHQGGRLAEQDFIRAA